MYERYEVPVEKLKDCCPQEVFDFVTTEEVPALSGIIGQERARRAVEFGLGVGNKGYNIYVAGLPGTGKTSYIKSVIESRSAQGLPPRDWCYLYNFQKPENPLSLDLPAGMGSVLQKDMEALVEELKQDIPRVFESTEYDEQKAATMQKYEKESAGLLSALEQEARSRGLLLARTDKGIVTTPAKEGKPLGADEYRSLSDEDKAEIDAKILEMGLLIEATKRKIKLLERQAREEMQEKESEFGLFAIRPSIDTLKDKYVAHNDVVSYLDEAQTDIVENMKLFMPAQRQATYPALLQQVEKDSLYRYKVNLFVDNSHTEGAPAVWETNPTYYNLFGKIEGESRFGAIATDFTMIRKGSVHEANGGYLVIQMDDILRDPLAWETLKRTLENEEAVVENIGEGFRIMPTVSLKPAPIPTKVKVILIGSPLIYQALYTYDEDFRKLFKVRAQFDSSMERTDANIAQYARFVSAICTQEGLRHFQSDAVRSVVEYSCRLAESKDKLSTRFNEIVEVLYEANAWAELSGDEVVSRSHVRRAIEEKIVRSNLPEERIQEAIHKGEILADVTGEAVGQMNGLSVVNLGDYTFGQVSRITASAFLGRAGIVNIEREAKMSGNVHDKGVLILGGYVGGRYAKDKPLSFSASICFEQSYGGIDGDSATLAELLALLSAIAGVPLKQNLAITGSLNQKGEVQPVGGVNQKIEGFYKTCKTKGLTGTQGVVIPHQNVANLMLADEIVRCAQEGQFHVYWAKTIDDAIALVTDMDPEEFHEKVDRSLLALARRASEFSSPGSRT